MGSDLITLDTSALFALLHRRDPNHYTIETALRQEAQPFLIPVALQGELAYLVEGRLGLPALLGYLDDLISRRYTLDFGDQDLPRVRELVQRFDDLPLGFVDAAVIACAERHGGRVLTLDLRHFGVVAREGTITIVP